MARKFAGGTNIITCSNINELTGDKTIVCDLSITSNTGILVRVEIAGGTGYQVDLGANLFLDALTNFDVTNAQTTCSVALTSGANYTMAATFTNSTLKWRIFIGSLTSSMVEQPYSQQIAGANTAAAGAISPVFGNRSNLAAPLTGTLGRCAVYNRVLTLPEMELYRQGSVTFNGLQNYWPLTDPNTANNFDLIAGANGTVSGATSADDIVPSRLPGYGRINRGLRPAQFKPGSPR